MHLVNTSASRHPDTTVSTNASMKLSSARWRLQEAAPGRLGEPEEAVLRVRPHSRQYLQLSPSSHPKAKLKVLKRWRFAIA
ncbi:hypothetical protein AAHC03_016607 [Spirometra sp. Aus1]